MMLAKDKNKQTNKQANKQGGEVIRMETVALVLIIIFAIVGIAKVYAGAL
jgi:hypothetical protein